MKQTTLYTVIPCYNEEDVLSETLKRLLELYDKMKADSLISSSSRIVFVDDGSKDRTWELISQFESEHREVCRSEGAHV